jgi:hypothetical protein
MLEKLNLLMDEAPAVDKSNYNTFTEEGEKEQFEEVLEDKTVHLQSTGIVEQSNFYETQIDQLKKDLEKLKQTEEAILNPCASVSNSSSHKNT